MSGPHVPHRPEAGATGAAPVAKTAAPEPATDPFDILSGGLLELGGRPLAPAEGMCHACGERTGRSACRACLRITCASDLWTMFALCRICVPEDRMQRWHVRGEVDGENWLAGAKA